MLMKNDVNTGNKDVATDDLGNIVTSDLDVVADVINEVVTNNSSIVTSDEIDEKKLARKKSTLKSKTKRYLLDFCTYKDFLEVFLWIKADARLYMCLVELPDEELNVKPKYMTDEERKFARTKSTLKSQAKRYILNFCFTNDLCDVLDWLQEGMTKWLYDNYYSDCEDIYDRRNRANRDGYYEICLALDIMHDGIQWFDRVYSNYDED